VQKTFGGSRATSAHKEHIQTLLTIWSACVLKSAQLLVSNVQSSSRSTSEKWEASTSDVEIESLLRAEVRASVLCGGHVEPSITSLQTLLQLLAGRASPSELLVIPHSILNPGMRVPDVLPVTIHSWQGKLLKSFISKLCDTLAYSSQPLLALLAMQREQRNDNHSSWMRTEAVHALPSRRDAVVSHVILQELAGAACGFSDLGIVEALAKGNGQRLDIPAARSDVFLPLLVALHCVGVSCPHFCCFLWFFSVTHPYRMSFLAWCCPFQFETPSLLNAVSGAEKGDSSPVQAACNAIAFARCVVNSPQLRGGLGYALILRVLLLPILQCVARVGTKENHAAVCFELVMLVHASLPAAELLPPLATGSFYPGPHHTVPAHATLGWYALQQGILCGLQVCVSCCCFSVQNLMTTCCPGDF
jgi:hypothetical protein